jgi:hypothetical protein
MTDLVIISKHEKGFWQADLYRNAWEISPSDFEQMGLSPDEFFTLKRGESQIAAHYKARERWPDAKIDGKPLLGSAIPLKDSQP